jgi:hypothetical protein
VEFSAVSDFFRLCYFLCIGMLNSNSHTLTFTIPGGNRCPKHSGRTSHMPVQEQAVREAEALPAVEAAGATAEAVADGRSSDGNDDGSQEDLRRSWTSEEDELIAQLVAQHGTNWTLIGTKLKNRSGQQCCERYQNVLDPFFRQRAAWTREEDLAIVAAQHKLGNRWTAIAKLVSGRTSNAIRTHWN